MLIHRLESIGRTFHHAQRFRDIVRVFLKYGYEELAHRLHLPSSLGLPTRHRREERAAIHQPLFGRDVAQPALRRPRFWPALVLIAVYWTAHFVVAAIDKPYFYGFVYNMWMTFNAAERRRKLSDTKSDARKLPLSET